MRGGEEREVPANWERGVGITHLNMKSGGFFFSCRGHMTP